MAKKGYIHKFKRVDQKAPHVSMTLSYVDPILERGIGAAIVRYFILAQGCTGIVMQ